MNDIHLPAPVSWWPPAPGWWLVPIVLLLAYFVARMVVVAARRRLRRRRVRTRALEELMAIESDFDATGDAAGAMERLSVLLRRVALTVSADARLAGTTGEGWVEWLREAGPRDLDGNALEVLVQAPYRPVPAVEVAPVLDAARRWVVHVAGRPPGRA